MARDTAEVRPDAIINSKRPSGASPNPARPDLGQGSPQMSEADTKHTTAGDTGRAQRNHHYTAPSRSEVCAESSMVVANPLQTTMPPPPIRASQQALASHAPAMFVATEADDAAVRAVYQQRGEFAAAIELRRRFPGITDNAQARECVRTIAGWKPPRPVKRMPEVPRLRRRI